MSIFNNRRWQELGPSLGVGVAAAGAAALALILRAPGALIVACIASGIHGGAFRPRTARLPCVSDLTMLVSLLVGWSTLWIALYLHGLTRERPAEVATFAMVATTAYLIGWPSLRLAITASGPGPRDGGVAAATLIVCVYVIDGVLAHIQTAHAQELVVAGAVAVAIVIATVTLWPRLTGPEHNSGKDS